MTLRAGIYEVFAAIWPIFGGVVCYEFGVASIP